MKATMTSLLSIALFVASAVAQSFQINTPGNAVECQPTQITWSGGTPPYFLSILPGGQPSAPALEQFTGLTGTSFTWNTNIASGQSVGLTLRDSVGALAQSAPFTINPGTDSSCLTASPSSSGSDTSSPSASPPVVGSSTPAASSAPTTPAASTPVSTPAASSPVSSRPASSGASSASRSSGSSSANPSATGATNGAVAQVASLGAAAVVGAAVAAILA